MLSKCSPSRPWHSVRENCFLLQRDKTHCRHIHNHMALCMGRWTTSSLVMTTTLMDTLFLKIYHVKSVLKLALGWDKAREHSSWSPARDLYSLTSHFCLWTCFSQMEVHLKANYLVKMGCKRKKHQANRIIISVLLAIFNAKLMSPFQDKFAFWRKLLICCVGLGSFFLPPLAFYNTACHTAAG